MFSLRSDSDSLVWMSFLCFWFFSRLHFAISSSTSWVSYCGTQSLSCGCPSGWPEAWETIQQNTAGLPLSTSSCASWFSLWWYLACRWLAGKSWLASACPSLCWSSLWSLSTWCSLDARTTCPSSSTTGTFCPGPFTPWRRGTLWWPRLLASAANTAAAAVNAATAATKMKTRRSERATRRVWRCTITQPCQETRIQRRVLKQHTFNITKFNMYLNAIMYF